MKWLRLAVVLAVLATVLSGCTCTTEQVGQIVEGLAKIPFADRTETEIGYWFYTLTIIDDKPMTSGYAINGHPIVLLIHEGPELKIGGTSYPAVLCITQSNELQEGETAKYAARVGIKALDNPDLFECGEIDLSEQSCDDGQWGFNVMLHDKSELESAFRAAVNQWLQDDVVKTLKSTTNKEGFADPANAQPRNPAQVRGYFYTVTENKGIWSLNFFAE